MARFNFNFFKGAGAATDAARGGGAVADASKLTEAARASENLKNINELIKKNPAFAKQFEGLDDAAKLRKMDELSEATKGAGAAGDAATGASKAQKSSFLARNAGTLLAGGLVAGGVLYLDDKYKQEEKEVKDCMKVCLPDNWDDYAYGDLKKSELKYKEIPNAGEQPLCTAQIEDCGAYCGDKCKEIHDYDAPGSGLFGGLAGDAGEAAGNVFSSLFGGLLEGTGLDTTMVGVASSASSSMIMMVLMIMLLK